MEWLRPITGGNFFSHYPTASPHNNQQLLEAAEHLGGAEEWGLTSAFQEVWLEPYWYSVALVRESLDAINEVAAYTDVSRLFQVDQPIPPLKDEAPVNSVFEWGKRLSLLA